MIFIDKIAALLRRFSPSVILVMVNVAVFIVLRLIAIVLRFADVAGGIDSVVDSLLLPHTFDQWIYAPWTALTYMFVQYDPMHLIMNMLWLYMFGGILDKMVSHRQFYATYIFGGIIGAFFYLILGSWFIPFSAGLTGASASILAVMASAVVMMPNLRLRLFLLGEVTLKVVAIIAILLVLIATGMGNFCVHAAHAGGFVAGIAMVYAWRKWPLETFRFARKSISKSVDKCEQSDATLDQLLDKIRRSGFNSLTRAERMRLIKISSELQKQSNEKNH